MTDTANLEDGFYWVRFSGTEYWEVSLRISGRFFMAGYVGTMEVDEIDPRPIKREKKQ